MVMFSFTLPATRLAVPAFNVPFVGLGRALLSAVPAIIFLWVRRERFPREHRGALAVVALGIVFGFPYFSALALKSVPSVHAAVVIGLLPAATAAVAVLRYRERPPLLFWLGVGAGVLSVLAFGITLGAGRLQIDDVWLLVAVLTGAIGYAEGARLTREIGGVRVVSWVVVISAPVAALFVARDWPADVTHSAPLAWLCFAYVGLVSMYFGFFAWYRGLATGGIARVSQVQLVQPILTLVWSALLLREHVSFATGAAALAVVASAALATFTRTRAAPALATR